MGTTRNALREITANVDESMGVRQTDLRPQFGPVASAKDIGRSPNRRFVRLSVDQIVPDPGQPRNEFGEDGIQHLAASLRSGVGQLQPIRVRWNGDVEKWIVVSGERRLRATLAAGLTEIDCYCERDGISESEVLKQQLVENLLRDDLKPLEEARGYASLMELNEWNGKQVAKALHVSQSRVSRALGLLDLPSDVQNRIESGDIPRTSAYELCKLDNAQVQRDLAEQAAAGGLTQRAATKAVRQRKGKSASKARGLRQVFVAENDIKTVVTASSKKNYYEVEEALQQALDEVRHRITNNVHL